MDSWWSASRRAGAGWLAAATPETVAWLVVSAFVGIVIGDNLWLHSLQVLGARRVILIDILKPFIALAMARFVLLGGISVSVALGMVVTLCGVLAVSLEKTEDHERGPAENNTEKDGDVDGSIPDDVLLEVALDDAPAPKRSTTRRRRTPTRNPSFFPRAAIEWSWGTSPPRSTWRSTRGEPC